MEEEEEEVVGGTNAVHNERSMGDDEGKSSAKNFLIQSLQNLMKFAQSGKNKLKIAHSKLTVRFILQTLGKLKNGRKQIKQK